MTPRGARQLWSVSVLLLALSPAVRVHGADANTPASVGPTKAAVVVVAAPPAPVSELDSQTLRRGPPLSDKPKPTTQKTGSNSTSPRNNSGYDAVRVTSALVAVIALILMLRWVAKRVFGVSGPGRSWRGVQVLSLSSLPPRQSVILVRVGRRILVVADGGAQMSTLSEIS